MSNFTFDDTNNFDAEDSGQYDGDCLSLKCKNCGVSYEYPDCWNCGCIDGVSLDELRADENGGAHNAKSTENQRNELFNVLQKRPITTLEARAELYIMAPAARVFELKEKGHKIITRMVEATFGSKKKIAQYVLLTGGVADE